MDGPAYTKSNEGCRLAAYLDTRGNWTCGFGATGADVVEGTAWTQDRADARFAEDYACAAFASARDVGNATWAGLDDVRRAALVDEAFQIGGRGLLKFVRMLAAVREENWTQASAELLDSLEDRQTPGRTARNAGMLLTGAWPADIKEGEAA